MPHQFGQHERETNDDIEGCQLQFGIVRGGLVFVPGVKAVCQRRERGEDQHQKGNELKQAPRHILRISARA